MPDALTYHELEQHIVKKLALNRQALVPSWIRFLAWIFLGLGLVGPAYIFAAYLFGFSVPYVSYDGLHLGLMGVLVGSLYCVFAALAAYGLLYGKLWAVSVCLVHAYLYLAIMLGNILFGNDGVNLLELTVLAIYLQQLHKLRALWN